MAKCSCEQRIELRERRPPSEIYKDSVQDSLENELKVVTEARTMLQKAAKEANNKKADLETVLVYLGKDMAKTRNPPATIQKSFSLPQIGKEPAGKSAQPESNSAPSTTKASKLAESQSFVPSHDDPVLQAMKTDELLREAANREEKAALVVKIGAEVLAKVNQSCIEAGQRVSFCLEKKCVEIGYLKKELHEQLKDTHVTLAETEKVLNKLKRTHPQLDSNLKKIETLEKAVESLLLSKAKLEDNYRCKTASLNVEQSCKLLSAGKVDARRTMKARTDDAAPAPE